MSCAAFGTAVPFTPADVAPIQSKHGAARVQVGGCVVVDVVVVDDEVVVDVVVVAGHLSGCLLAQCGCAWQNSKLAASPGPVNVTRNAAAQPRATAARSSTRRRGVIGAGTIPSDLGAANCGPSLGASCD
jgi:hypothetical protein